MTSTNRADSSVQATCTPEAFRLDLSADGLTMYVGHAAPGTAESETYWRVKRIVLTAEGDVTGQWANGNSMYVNVWDDRASLNYT